MTRKGIAYWVCYGLCHLFSKTPLKRYGLRAKALGGRFENRANYVADRISNVESYRRAFRSFANFGNKTVMELGCNSGYMLAAFLEQEPFKAIGVDIEGSYLKRGRAAYGERIEFVQSTEASVPLPDNSVDLIYCVDTIEHLSRPREILLDCFRILRPSGRFLIHWHPWLGPYGSHLEDIIPFPWAHAVFSMDTLLQVAADIYDSPNYTPAWYWKDADTDQRRPNPFQDRHHWETFLNKMTVRDFRRLLRNLPYRVVEFRRRGFGGKSYRAAKLLGGLAHVPLFDEFFLQAVICVMEKPAAARD